MKLLVFAHIPPPHHGQSYMVRLMLAGFGGDHRKPSLKRKAPLEEELPSLDPDAFGIDCYHVDARLSLGVVLLKSGRRTRAREEWEKCLAQNPEDVRARAYIDLLDSEDAPEGRPGR